MRTHQDRAAVQLANLPVIANLAVNAENKAKIATAGGIDAVVLAMRTHQDVAAVQEKGSIALQYLKSSF